MSDKTIILRTLRTLPDVLFVPPAREVYTQDELHSRARELRTQRGLAPDYPYVGWHHQANGFDTKGRLLGVQRIYFGGDRNAVCRALSALEPQEFAVLGGRSDGEAFVIRRDARPDGVTAHEEESWKVRLDVLGDDLCAPLRDGEEMQLHEIATGSALGRLSVAALRALRLRNLLGSDDLDIALRPELRDHLGAETTPLVVHALESRHPLAQDAVAHLAGAGRADAPMLIAWGGVQALKAAHDHALADPRRIPREYLALVAENGGDSVAAAISLAEEIRAADPAHPHAADGVLAALTELFGGSSTREWLAVVNDPRVPLWLAALATEGKPQRPGDPAQQVARRTHLPDRGVSPEDKASWLDAVDAIRTRAGLVPSAGYDIFERVAQSEAVEQREFILARHGEGLLAAIRRDDLDEPAAAVLLELLHPAGLLTAESLDPLVSGWKRIFVEPSPYTSAPPAAVLLAVAATMVGHPAAAEIVQTIASDTRRWTEPLRFLLHGAFAWGSVADGKAEEELRKTAFSTDTRVRSLSEAQLALALVRSRLRGISPVRAAIELAVETPRRPRYLSLGFAATAIALVEGGSGLRAHSFSENSPRALRAALDLAGNAETPLEVRRDFLHHAARTRVLNSPLARTLAVPTAEECQALEETLSRLRNALGPESA